MDPFFDCTNNIHKRKMLTIIKLDFIYDINPMKMRIDDLEAV